MDEKQCDGCKQTFTLMILLVSSGSKQMCICDSASSACNGFGWVARLTIKHHHISMKIIKLIFPETVQKYSRAAFSSYTIFSTAPWFPNHYENMWT